jgi:hypothetical protein
LSPSEAEQAIARIRAEGRAADEIVRWYHADTADRMERLLRRALAARWEAAERAVVAAIDPARLPPLESEEDIFAFAEFDDRLAALREEIASGLKQAQQGDLIPGGKVFARLRAKSAERSQNTSTASGESEEHGS